MNTTQKYPLSGNDAKKLQAAGVRYGRSHQRREAKERARIRRAVRGASVTPATEEAAR
jgi:hypothetical protein